VRQLVGEELAARVAPLAPFASTENDRISERECAGVDGARQLARGRAGVEPHAGEIAAEARLEEGALGVGQRPAAALELGEALLEALGHARRPARLLLRLRTGGVEGLAYLARDRGQGVRHAMERGAHRGIPGKGQPCLHRTGQPGAV
jgi:hypothetical protein